MRSLFEELGGTYTLGKDGMYYPNLAIEETDQRSIGKWGRMHREYRSKHSTKKQPVNSFHFSLPVSTAFI